MESAAITQQGSVSTTTTTAPISAPPYSESLDSSPRSWEGGAGDAPPPVPAGGSKLRLMCSYGGHIVPRPHDKSLCYVGGETRIVVVDRNSTVPELLQRISKMLLDGRPFTLKYQLPNEDLDSLITVSSEEDLENMIEEYDRLTAAAKSSRIRLFLFPATKLQVAASMGPILDGSSNKSDDWFMNGADLLQRGFSDPSGVNTLLGLEENGRRSRNLDLNSNQGEGQVVLEEGRGKVGNQTSTDVLDSSFVETNSSFGSASSAPAMANLPRIRVHVEEGSGRGRARVFDQRIGIEDQFAHMGVQKQEEGFSVMSSPPSNLPSAGVPVSVSGEYANRMVSDDERSDHGAPVGYRNHQQQQMMMEPNSQQQNKQINEDLPSPSSVSSDCSSLSNTTARQKPIIYQDPSGSNRAPANFIDQKIAYTDSSGQVQQVIDSGYVLPSHYDQLQHQSILQQQAQQQQPGNFTDQKIAYTDSSGQVQQVSDSGYVMPSHYDQLQHQSIQHQQAQHQQQQQQQFIHASNHYVQHHPSNGVPLSYYPIYPPQQATHQHQIDQRYHPVYYVPAGQTHAYNLPVQHTEAANMAQTSQPQNPSYTTIRNIPPPKSEIPQTGIYMTGNPANPQLVQMQQQQFMGYSQIQHPSQSMTPAQAYFTKTMAPQYQTVNSGPAMVMSDADNVKPQIRTSQAL